MQGLSRQGGSFRVALPDHAVSDGLGRVAGFVSRGWVRGPDLKRLNGLYI